MNKKLKIFLDDSRPAPKGWIAARWPEDVIRFIKQGNIETISLDHDLGDDNHGTGYDVILWIEKEVYSSEGFIPPKILIHSSNSSARKKMEKGVAAILKGIQARQ